MESQKFTQEELVQIQNLRNESSQLINQLGQIEAEKFLTHQRIEQLDNSKNMLLERLDKLQASETELLSSLTEKYGDGTVDVASGEFKPAN